MEYNSNSFCSAKAQVEQSHLPSIWLCKFISEWGGGDYICKSTKQCKSRLPYILYYCEIEWFQGSCIWEEPKCTLGPFIQNTHCATAILACHLNVTIWIWTKPCHFYVASKNWKECKHTIFDVFNICFWGADLIQNHLFIEYRYGTKSISWIEIDPDIGQKYCQSLSIDPFDRLWEILPVEKIHILSRGYWRWPEILSVALEKSIGQNLRNMYLYELNAFRLQCKPLIQNTHRGGCWHWPNLQLIPLLAPIWSCENKYSHTASFASNL